MALHMRKHLFVWLFGTAIGSAAAIAADRPEIRTAPPPPRAAQTQPATQDAPAPTTQPQQQPTQPADPALPSTASKTEPADPPTPTATDAPVNHTAAPPPDAAKPTATVKPDLEALRTQVNALLVALQTANAPEHDQIIKQLDQIIAQCSNTPTLLSNPDLQLEAAAIALQVHHTLSLQAKDLQTAHDRISRLQALAWKVKKTNSPAASVLGDYWLLQAAMFDIHRAETEADARQRLTIERLEKFIEEHTPPTSDQHNPQTATHQSILTNIKLALLGLYDHRGMSAQARHLVNELQQSLDYDDPTQQYLNDWFGYCTVIGQHFDAKLMTNHGQSWASQAHRGRTVLLHFWSDAIEPSVEAVESLKTQYPDLHSRGLDVLSVRVGPTDAPQPQTLTTDWPTCAEQNSRASLSTLFHIRSLPRFVLIDPHGKVTAIAASLSILEQAQPLLADPADDSAVPIIGSPPNTPTQND